MYDVILQSVFQTFLRDVDDDGTNGQSLTCSSRLTLKHCTRISVKNSPGTAASL